ncbi:cytoskeletal protein RodZ [Rhizobium sp. BK049]|nr:cytoskeletal protein RodZ [Rhizobium sp. BK049]
MAHQTETRWEKSDGKLHKEQQIPPVKAKQGRMGYRILTVLLVALILAFVVWIPVEIWGRREANEVAPQQPGQQLQQQQSDAAPAPTMQNGKGPTETPATAPAPNSAPAAPTQPAAPAQ